MQVDVYLQRSERIQIHFTLEIKNGEKTGKNPGSKLNSSQSEKQKYTVETETRERER